MSKSAISRSSRTMSRSGRARNWSLHVVVKRWTTMGADNQIFHRHRAGDRSTRPELFRRPQLPQDRRRQPHSRALHDQPRRRSRVGHRNRRQQLHHDLGPHRPQLPYWFGQRDLQLLPHCRSCGNRRPRLHLRRRSCSPVFENRTAGADQRPYARAPRHGRPISSIPISRSGLAPSTWWDCAGPDSTPSKSAD